MSIAPSNPASQRTRNFKIFGTVIGLIAVASLGNWVLTHNWEGTDDAFVDGEVVQLAPQTGGRVLAVHFSDNDTVKQGDLLVEIDPQDAMAALQAAQGAADAAAARVEQATANMQLALVTTEAERGRAQEGVSAAKRQMEQARYNAEAAKAELERTKSDRDRYQRLFDATFASRQKLEQVEAEAQSVAARWQAAQAASAGAENVVGQATNQLKSASTVDLQIALKRAELALAMGSARQAQGDLANAQLNLSYTRILAPQSGRVSRKAVAVGDMIQRGQVLTQLVAGQPWVVANFKETQLSRMRPNQKAIIKIDAFPGLKLEGHVRAIQPGSGSRFSLLPPENATGNFVKVVQRVPVRIDLDNPGPEVDLLVLGMSADPKVDVSGP